MTATAKSVPKDFKRCIHGAISSNDRGEKAGLISPKTWTRLDSERTSKLTSNCCSYRTLLIDTPGRSLTGIWLRRASMTCSVSLAAFTYAIFSQIRNYDVKEKFPICLHYRLGKQNERSPRANTRSARPKCYLLENKEVNACQGPAFGPPKFWSAERSILPSSWAFR